MESLTIKELECLCAAFESVFGEDADFMVWLESNARVCAGVDGEAEGGLQ